MNNVVMKASDTISGSLAECFVTIGRRRYNNADHKLEATFEKLKLKFYFRQNWQGNKATGWKAPTKEQCIITLQF